MRPPQHQRIGPVNDHKGKPRIGQVAPVVDTREDAAYLVRLDERAAVYALATASPGGAGRTARVSLAGAGGA